MAAAASESDLAPALTSAVLGSKLWESVSRRFKLRWGWLGDVGVGLVHGDRTLTISVVNGSSLIHRECAVGSGHRVPPRGEKKNVGSNRLQEHPVMNHVNRSVRRRPSLIPIGRKH